MECPQCNQRISLDQRRTTFSAAVLTDSTERQEDRRRAVKEKVRIADERLKTSTKSLLQAAAPFIEPHLQHVWTKYQLKLAEEIEEALGRVYEAKRKRVAAQQSISDQQPKSQRTFYHKRKDLQNMMDEAFSADEAVAEVTREYREKFNNDAQVMEKVQIVTQRWRETTIR